MAASFPASVKSFTTKVDGPGNPVNASHMNDLQDEMAAVETVLVNGQARAQVYASVSVSIPDNVATAVTFNTEDFDTGALHSTVSNTSRLTVPSGAGGVYLVTATIAFAANATGSRQLQFYKNGSGVSATFVAPGHASLEACITATFLVSLSAADYMECYVVQDSGGALGVSANSRFGMVKVW